MGKTQTWFVGLSPTESAPKQISAKLSSLENAESMLALIRQHDPKGVANGDYHLDGPSED